MKLSLVVPCYNEEGNVEAFYTEVSRVFSESNITDYELVFVNDGSTDLTFKKLKGIFNAHPESDIKVVSFSRNFGKEAALYAGLQKATGDLVCLIDADLQQRPEVVVEMLRRMEEDENIDCVAAYQQIRKEGRLLSAIKSAFYKVINRMSEVDFVNGASDFRLMKRRMVDAILQMTEYHRFSKGLFGYVGFHTVYLPYEVAEREKGKSKWNLRALIKYAFEGIFAFSTMPLKFATVLGFLFSFCSLLYLLVVLVQKLAFGINVPGYATLVILVLLLGGIQLFALGVLGEYISKMYVQVKNRPIYILKDYLSHDEKDQ